ncbi:MAG: WG repeat-containing protein [Clostridia bacterium]|nr:WG repeat-containing protein [Clostridia bacterium]
MKQKLPVRTLTALVLVVACAGSWVLLFQRQATAAREYGGKKQEATELYQKKIYDEALDLYEECRKTDPSDPDVLLSIARIRFHYEQYTETVLLCERVRKLAPDRTAARRLEAKAYANSRQVGKAIRLLEPIRSRDERARKLLLRFSGLYDLEFLDVQDPGDWWNSPDGKELTIVTERDHKAVYLSDGTRLFPSSFSELGLPNEDGSRFPAKAEGNWCYVDEKGKLREVPDEPFVFLGTFRDGLAPAASEQFAGFVDSSFQWKQQNLETACPFTDGYALIKKDGSFHIMDRSFNWTADCEFTEVKASDHFPVRNGVLLGKVGERWRVYKPDGSRIGSLEAEDFRFPEEPDGILAYRSGERWGFMKQDGTVVLEPAYEDARSFSKGYAAVKENGKWGYINTDGEWLIPAQFETAGPVSRAGTAFVGNSAGTHLLKLKRYQTDHASE